MKREGFGKECYCKVSVDVCVLVLVMICVRLVAFSRSREDEGAASKACVLSAAINGLGD